MILFWKIILQIILVGIAVLISFLDYVKTDKRTKKFKRIRNILFVLVFISLALNIFVTVYDEQSKQQEVSELNQQIVLLQQKGDLASNLLTGGNSFCYYSLSNFGDNTAIAAVVIEGEYPLYDVTISITDVEDLTALQNDAKNHTVEELLAKDKVLKFENISPNLARNLETVTLPHPNEVKYSIMISARNGIFGEEIRLRKVNGVWKSAMKVEKVNLSGNDSNAQPILLKELIDPDFPKDENGKIW